MENSDYRINKNQQDLDLSQHVKLDIGHNYCIISCSKHRLHDLVHAVDTLTSKDWIVTSGLTSDDGLVLQAMTKISDNLNNPSNKRKGV